MEYMNTFIFSMVRYSALMKNLGHLNVFFHFPSSYILYKIRDIL